MTWVEAMAAGKPVIASAVAGPVDHIANGLTGMLVPPGDAAALATAARRLMEDRGLAIKLAAAAREAVMTQFTWDHAAARTGAVIRDVLAAGAPPRR